MSDAEKGRMNEQEFYIDPNGEAAAAKLWSVYVSEAEKYDKSLVESWKSDMEGILIFAGLFSASLTAFIIESYPTLVPDSGDATVQLLARISQQLAAASSGSTLDIPPPSLPFHPPATSLVCNTFWFTSLGFSLSCALIATLVQQWAREFLHKADMRSAPGVRARIFSFLYYGLKEFNMHKVVDVIPLLLHASLFLFFAGLVAFLIPISVPMAAVVAFILACITIVYSTLTILPLHYLDCPYRTPLSEAFWGLSRGFYRRSHIPAEEDDTDEPTMVQAMSQAAIEATSERDYRALVWTVKSLADETEFEPFAEAVPDVLWGPDYPRWSYRNHIKNLMQHPDLNLHRRFVQLHRSCDSGLLPPELSKRRRVTCCKALWALGSVGALVDTGLLGVETFDEQSEMGEYYVSTQAMIQWSLFCAVKSPLSKLAGFLAGCDLAVEVDLVPHLEEPLRSYLLDHQGRLTARNPVLSYQLYHLDAFPSSEVIPVLDAEINNILSTKAHAILLKFLVDSADLGAPPYRYNETFALLRSNSSALSGNQDLHVALSQLVNVGFHQEIQSVDSVEWFDRMVSAFCSLWAPDDSTSTTIPNSIINYLYGRKSDDAVRLLLANAGTSLWDTYSASISDAPADSMDLILAALWRVIELDVWRGADAYEPVLDALLDKLKDRDRSPVAISVLAMLKVTILNVLIWSYSPGLPLSPYLPTETSIPIPEDTESDSYLGRVTAERVGEGKVALLGDYLWEIQFQPGTDLELRWPPYKATDTVKFITENISIGLERVHAKHQNRIADALAGLWLKLKRGDEAHELEPQSGLLLNTVLDSTIFNGYASVGSSSDRMACEKLCNTLTDYADYLSQSDNSTSLPRVREILYRLESLLHRDRLDSS